MENSDIKFYGVHLTCGEDNKFSGRVYTSDMIPQFTSDLANKVINDLPIVASARINSERDYFEFRELAKLSLELTLGLLLFKKYQNQSR